MARVAVLALLLLPSCGYQLVHAPRDPLGPFSLASAPLRVPDAALAAAAEEGARAELSRAGQLGSNGAPAEIEIELIRVDETSEGIALGAQGAPLARGVRVTVIGRGRLRRAAAGVRDGGDPHTPGTAVARDTGDVRASEVAARAGGVEPAVVAREEAGRAAARRLGEVLVRRLLGFPEPGEP